MINFIGDIYEDDYILGLLQGFASELKTGNELDFIIDKYAVALTSYMQGQVKQAEK